MQWIFKPDAVSLHSIWVQRCKQFLAESEHCAACTLHSPLTPPRLHRNAPPKNGEERINTWDSCFFFTDRFETAPEPQDPDLEARPFQLPTVDPVAGRSVGQGASQPVLACFPFGDALHLAQQRNSKAFLMRNHLDFFFFFALEACQLFKSE